MTLSSGTSANQAQIHLLIALFPLSLVPSLDLSVHSRYWPQPLASNGTTNQRPCSGASCHSMRTNYLVPLTWEPSSNPWCARQFEQQVCEQAMYYIFSFNRYQRELIEHEAVKPFTPLFSVFLIAVLLLLALGALIVVFLLLQRTEYLQVQDPLERSFLSSSIRNVLFRTLHDHHLRLLLPMAFFVGLEQGFFIADFNKVSGDHNQAMHMFEVLLYIPLVLN